MASTGRGFDTSQVSPQDAIVTLRSLRRRFAEAFDQAVSPDVLGRAPTGGGVPPVEHAAWTAQALDAIGEALRQIQVSEHPSVALPTVDPSGPVAGGGDGPEAALTRLGDVARSVADAMAEVHGDEWSRTGHTPAGDVSALDVVRLGVRIGVEHLRAAEAAILAGNP